MCRTSCPSSACVIAPGPYSRRSSCNWSDRQDAGPAQRAGRSGPREPVAGMPRSLTLSRLGVRDQPRGNEGVRNNGSDHGRADPASPPGARCLPWPCRNLDRFAFRGGPGGSGPGPTRRAPPCCLAGTGCGTIVDLRPGRLPRPGPGEPE
jgi:hypothetical protein